ncbi:MAG: GNAT family N-acetyltransferase [bacterium]|nr:GNAT family N-acetyltransferase [bacterium]
MKISRLTREQKEFFLDMDPFLMMDWLDFPNTFALIATEKKEASAADVPMGLMICSLYDRSLMIDWLCVAADYRMQGVGEQLLVKAFEIAKQAKLDSVRAYMQEGYGRSLVCKGQEQYFAERLFEQEQALFGEWITDLRTLQNQPLFSRRMGNTGNAIPFRKLTTPMIKEAIAVLAASKDTAMLYDMSCGGGDCYDPDLSFLLMDEKQIRGGLIVQCVRHKIGESNEKTGIASEEMILYPVLFHAESEHDVSALLCESMQAACAKYAPETDVRIILTHERYERLCAYVLPKVRTDNKLLVADVNAF